LDPAYMEDYISFWFYVDPVHTKSGFHAFSSWIDDAVYNRYLVNQDMSFIQKLLPDLHKDYIRREQAKQLLNQMFWQYDVRDAMEESISGRRKVKNIRPTINSYMYGNAKALVAMSAIAKNDTLKKIYNKKATELEKLVHEQLWDDDAKFFKVQ